MPITAIREFLHKESASGLLVAASIRDISDRKLRHFEQLKDFLGGRDPGRSCANWQINCLKDKPE